LDLGMDDYHFYMSLLVQDHELAKFDEARREIFARYRHTRSPRAAEHVVKDCLILPWPDGDLDALEKMADSTLQTDPHHWAFGYFEFAKGLVAYRRGHFDTAVEYMERVLARKGEDRNRTVQAYMVLAMSRYQLGQTDEARAAFAAGSRYANSVLPGVGHLIDYLGWNDWIIAHALMREASALLPDPGQ
jgi:tetratricopeptide (TPR) repeat protein